MLSPLEEKTALVEDEAEKVAILAAPLQMDMVVELKELQLGAIRETERAVKAATAILVGARREIDKRRKEVTVMAPVAQAMAVDEFDKLSQRLDIVETKLDEHKNVRKEHELSLAVERLFDELATRLSSVEIDCEKASTMAEPLGRVLDMSAEASQEVEVREAKEAVRVAQATLAPLLRLINGKLSGLKGATQKKMLDLKVRAEASQAMLEAAQKRVDESQSRASATAILSRAAERAGAVEEVLQKMRETEGPFLMGIETMPADEASEVLSKMETAATLAQSALADAHKYIALNMMEVGRLAPSTADSARAELERVKAQLDEGLDRVRKFQVETAKRKRGNLVETVKEKVAGAEAAISKMKELGDELQAAEAGSLSSLASSLAEAQAAELEAQSLVAAARRELQERQHDLRPLEGNSADAVQNSGEVFRTKVRVNNMEAELTKFRKLARDFEERMQVEKSLLDVVGGIKEAEEEAERLGEIAKQWSPENKPAPEDEASIAAVQARLTSATAQVEKKLRSAQGLELKELRAVFTRMQRAQWKLSDVKKSALNITRSSTKKLVKDASDLVQQAETKVSALSMAAGKANSLPLARLEALQEESVEAQTLVKDAQAAITKGQGSELVLEGKVELARLLLRITSAERRCKAVVESMATHFEKVSSSAMESVLTALREAARGPDGAYDYDGLFSELCQEGTLIMESHLVEHFSKSSLSKETVQFACKKLTPHGLSRRAFAWALADVFKVVKDITVTNAFEITQAKKVRRLELGELLEAAGASKLDESLGLERVQCRAITDGVQGWVTVKSTLGTSYLERAAKPFLWCTTGTSLHKDSNAASKELRMVSAGEVLELLQGPKQESPSGDFRVRGTACHEDTSGWLQVRDKSGAVLAKLSNKVHKCVQAVAMTDGPDFSNCNTVRRVDTGEALEILPDKAVVPQEGGSRSKFRACRDGREGWITTTGSQGTVYMRAAPKHYICLQATPAHAGIGVESAVVRVLMQGEAWAALEDPKPVSGGDRMTMYNVRTTNDLLEGWVIASSEQEVRPWTSRYKVIKHVALTSDLADADSVEVTRLLEPNEMLEAVEHPVVDSDSGLLRVRCVALSDRAAGWATVRDGGHSGPLLLQPLAPGEEIHAESAQAPATPPRSVSELLGARAAKRSLQVKEEDDAPTHRNKFPKGKGKGKFKW